MAFSKKRLEMILLAGSAAVLLSQVIRHGLSYQINEPDVITEKGKEKPYSKRFGYHPEQGKIRFRSQQECYWVTEESYHDLQVGDTLDSMEVVRGYLHPCFFLRSYSKVKSSERD